MIDTHCHLTDTAFRDNLDGVLRDAASAGILGFVAPSVDLADSADAVATLGAIPSVRVAAGIHPLWADFPDEHACRNAVDELAAFTGSNRSSISAIGEIGLDTEPAPDGRPINRATRLLAFRLQLAMARDFGLPVIIHARGLTADVLKTLEWFGPAPAGGVMHAFSGSADTMRVLRKLGYLRGVAGTVTLPWAVRVANAIRASDPRDLVLETDAPFIPNAVHPRGTTVPGDLALVAAAVAALTGLELAELIRITDENARTIFGF